MPKIEPVELYHPPFEAPGVAGNTWARQEGTGPATKLLFMEPHLGHLSAVEGQVTIELKQHSSRPHSS